MNPNINFLRGWPSSPLPKRSDASINGSISTRAFQYCEPFSAANRIGYLVYPPIDFNLIWDGSQALVQLENMEEWIIIDKIYLPNSIDYWSETVPQNLIDTLPVFLEAFPERGVIQIWSGYFAETPTGSSTWIRGPINQPTNPAYNILEGIIETDWWAGPLFSNIQLLKTDYPIAFRKDKPFLQVFSIPKVFHQRNRDSEISVRNLNDINSIEFCQRMEVTANRRNSNPPGSYRRKSRNESNKD